MCITVSGDGDSGSGEVSGSGSGDGSEPGSINNLWQLAPNISYKRATVPQSGIANQRSMLSLIVCSQLLSVWLLLL